MNNFPYTLRHIEVNKISDDLVRFEVERPFFLLDCVVLNNPSFSPLNNMLLSMTSNPLLNVVGKVDISEYMNNPGTYDYTNFLKEDGDVQFVIVLLKN